LLNKVILWRCYPFRIAKHKKITVAEQGDLVAMLPFRIAKHKKITVAERGGPADATLWEYSRTEITWATYTGDDRIATHMTVMSFTCLTMQVSKVGGGNSRVFYPVCYQAKEEDNERMSYVGVMSCKWMTHTETLLVCQRSGPEKINSQNSGSVAPVFRPLQSLKCGLDIGMQKLFKVEKCRANH
jgi:hypothetical protein